MSTYLNAKKKIGSRNFSALYLIYGTERYIIDDLVQQIRKEALTEEERTFLFSSWDMRENPVQEGIEEAETAPFFGARRVILLKNARFLTGARDKEAPEHDLKKLEYFLDYPPEQTIVIVTVEADKLDERKKIVKKIKKVSECIEAKPLHGEQLRHWLYHQADMQNVTFTDEGMQELTQIAPQDLLSIEKEVQKCALYVGREGAITESVVRNLVTRSLEDNVFELIEAVSSGESGRALQIYDDLLRKQEEPIKIIALLGRQFRLMGLAAEMGKRGYSQQKMASSLGVPPFVASKIRKKTQGLQSERIQEALSILAETDYKMKQGSLEKETGVALIITRLPTILKK